MVALATARRPRRVRARAGGRGPRAAPAGRPRPALQPALPFPAPVVVGGADRRGRSPGSRWSASRATTVPIGPFRSRADAVDTAELLARFTGVRTCTARLGRARRSTARPAPSGRSSPCPAAARASPPRSTPPAPQRAADLIDGLRQRRAGGRGRSRSSELAGADALRERGPAARPDRRRQSTCSGAASGCGRWPRSTNWSPPRPTARAAGSSRWSGTVSWPRRARARRGVPPMPVVDALRAAAQVILPQPAPLGGALVEETALIARWLAAAGRPDRLRHRRVSPSPIGIGGPVVGVGGDGTLGAAGRRTGSSGWTQSSWVNRTQRASSCSAAPESMASAARLSPSSQDGSHSAWLDSPAWATIAPAALSTTASRTGPVAPAEHRARLRGVELGVAADQFAQISGAGKAEAQRVERQLVDGARLHPPDRARGRRGQLVEAVVAVHHQHAGAARGEHAGHHLGEVAERAADQAGPRAGRIGQRPKQIEHRRHADLPARRRRRTCRTDGTPGRSRTRCRPRPRSGPPRRARGRCARRAPRACRRRRSATTPPGCRA